MTTTSSRTGQQPGPAVALTETPQPAWRRPRWELSGLAVLLAGTGVLYLWQLAGNGWANTFYAAAVQAGTKNWTALFFGSLDSGNGITVDKPPASLWVMALSGRVFGFSSWSMLVPQALMGVGAVALLWAAVRRISGPGAALLAGTVLALTPVAALMFRFNNPDALLVLLMVAAAYCTLRAIEKAGTRWLLAAGLLIGLGFLAKMLEVFLVTPGLALAYLWAAPVSLGRRIRQLLAAGLAIVVGAGWWLLAVALWPVSSRPYIGGSTDNSPLELAFGYNGLSRIFGQGRPGGGTRPLPAGGDLHRGLPGGAGGLFGGHTGLSRLFTGSFGTQAAWLLPAALLLLVVGLWLTRRAGRTDLVRAGLLLGGGWVLVTALVFSYMTGIIHQYYTVALAPGIAAVLAIGGREVWQQRNTWAGRTILAVATAGTALWAQTMLGWSPEFLPWLRWVVLVAGVIAAVAFLVPRSGPRWLAVATTIAVTAGLTAPTAYAVETVVTPRSGPLVTAGPPVTQSDAPGPGGFPAGFPGMNRRGSERTMPRGSGGPDIAATNPELVALLKAAPTKWSAATITGSSAASLELASGTAVLGIGGFMGSDPYPTLDQFKSYVASGQIRYFVTGPIYGGRFTGGFPGTPEGASPGGFPGRDGGGPTRGGPDGFANGPGSQISQWVTENYTATTIGGQTIYNLSQPKT